MKGLVEYLLENINEHLLMESDGVIKYLISDFRRKSDEEEEVIKTAEEFFDNSPQMKTMFCGSPDPNKKDYAKGLETLKSIFDYRDKHINDIAAIKDRPEPIIANYGGLNKFCFRRWVRPVLLELEIKNISPRNKSGEWSDGMFHNTNLGKKWLPNAQDMEEVIATAYNNIHLKNKGNDTAGLVHNPNESLDDDIFFEDNNIATHAEKIEQYYLDHKEIFDIIARKIHTKCPPLRKLPGKLPITKEWAELGGFESKLNSVPKTDIISYNESDDEPTTQLRISVKKTGGSQPMSGTYHESRATLIHTLKTSGKDETEEGKDFIDLLTNRSTMWRKIRAESSSFLVKELSKIGIERNEYIGRPISEDELNDLKERINKSDTSKENKELYCSYLETIYYMKNTTDVIKRWMEDKDFKLALMKEALTGETKFGKDSFATANYVLEWDDDNPEKSEMFNINEYIDKYFDVTKAFLGFKTGAKDPEPSLRITVGKVKEIE